MAQQGLTQEQKQKQRMALEQQRMLGTILEKNDAEMEEFIDNKIKEIDALEKKSDENDGDDGGYDSGESQEKGPREENNSRGDDPVSENSGDDDMSAWYRFIASNRSRDDEYYAPTAVSEKTLQELPQHQ